MSIRRWNITIGLALLLGMISMQSALAQADTDAAATAKPAPPALKHLSINLEKGYVDVDGVICLSEGLLELIATVPASKEHEAIISSKARPKNIHLALLMLGLEPGSPGKWEYTDDKIIAHDPKGDHVRITMRYEKDGKTVERPVNELVRDSKTKKVMKGNEFVFAGSRIAKPAQGDPFYAADASGDVVTLVSFPEELMALPTAASNSNENLVWEANTSAIPPIGTDVTLRIYAVKKVQKKDK
ncbi:hypothetical protein HED60_17235 [Planctomycetales bacterium ZRK34]|nr:hypothetical protein HED60_17235 [Planctomycetales bacterium ZRK34]